MIKIEDFVKKRKNDEKINEFALNSKNENLHIFIGYIIEYFNTMLILMI